MCLRHKAEFNQEPRNTGKSDFICRFPRIPIYTDSCTCSGGLGRSKRTVKIRVNLWLIIFSCVPALKLSRYPRFFAATLAALPSISEIPFLDSSFPDSIGLLSSNERSRGHNSELFIKPYVSSTLVHRGRPDRRRRRKISIARAYAPALDHRARYHRRPPRRSHNASVRAADKRTVSPCRHHPIDAGCNSCPVHLHQNGDPFPARRIAHSSDRHKRGSAIFSSLYCKYGVGVA